MEKYNGCFVTRFLTAKTIAYEVTRTAKVVLSSLRLLACAVKIRLLDV
jgi:hypothetical protein